MTVPSLCQEQALWPGLGVLWLQPQQTLLPFRQPSPSHWVLGSKSVSFKNNFAKPAGLTAEAAEMHRNDKRSDFPAPAPTPLPPQPAQRLRSP